MYTDSPAPPSPGAPKLEPTSDSVAPSVGTPAAGSPVVGSSAVYEVRPPSTTSATVGGA